MRLILSFYSAHKNIYHIKAKNIDFKEIFIDKEGAYNEFCSRFNEIFMWISSF